MRIKFFVTLVWCLLASYLPWASAQGFTGQEMSWPAGVTSATCLTTGMALTTAPDGRLWMICGNGAVLGQKALGSTQLILAGILPASVTLQQKKIASTQLFLNGAIVAVTSVAVMPSFSPQNGETITLGPAVIANGTYRDFEYQVGINPPSLTKICADYTVGGTAIPTSSTVSGPWGNEKFIVTAAAGKKTAQSTMYSKGKTSPTGTCDLVNGTTLDGEVLQAWQQADGIVKEVAVSVDPINWASTEIGIQAPNGSTKVLVSPRDSSAQFFANLCCDMVFDQANQNALVTYRVPAGRALVRFKDGTTKVVYANEDGRSSANIKALSLRGEWSLITTGNKSQWTTENQSLVNITTGKVLPITGNSPGGTPWGGSAISPDGTIFSGGSTENHEYKIFMITQTGPPAITSLAAVPAMVVQGGTSTVSWTTKNTTSVTILPMSLSTDPSGFVPLNGSVVVTPGIGVTTITLTATGPLGSDHATVTVTVTPKTPVPTFVAAGVVNAASFKAPVSAGSIASVFGANLASGTVTATTVPLPTTLLGTQVLISGVATPLWFVSAGQINFQVPVETAGSSATMQVVSSLGASTVVTVPLSVTPGLFLGVDGKVITQDPFTGALLPSAKVGNVVVVYGTGFGATECPVKTGQVSPAALCRTLAPTDVVVGGQKAEVLFAGLTPGLIGVYQINLVVPQPAMSTMIVPIVVDLNGQKSDDSAQIAIAR